MKWSNIKSIYIPQRYLEDKLWDWAIAEIDPPIFDVYNLGISPVIPWKDVKRKDVKPSHKVGPNQPYYFPETTNFFTSGYPWDWWCNKMSTYLKGDIFSHRDGDMHHMQFRDLIVKGQSGSPVIHKDFHLTFGIVREQVTYDSFAREYKENNEKSYSEPSESNSESLPSQDLDNPIIGFRATEIDRAIFIAAGMIIRNHKKDFYNFPFLNGKDVKEEQKFVEKMYEQKRNDKGMNNDKQIQEFDEMVDLVNDQMIGLKQKSHSSQSSQSIVAVQSNDNAAQSNNKKPENDKKPQSQDVLYGPLMNIVLSLEIYSASLLLICCVCLAGCGCGWFGRDMVDASKSKEYQLIDV